MSAAAQPRVARAYTSARRHPWVLGRLGDWTVPFGPYTPAQLVVLGGGAFALINTFAWWSWAGPVPVVLWLGAVWAVRGAQIAGQNPFTAVLGGLVLLLRHPAGRISGRVARDRRPSYLFGQFIIEPAPAPVTAGVRAAGLVAGPSGGLRSAGGVAGSGLSRLLAQTAPAGRGAA
ncbi:conjugal transfer protein [Streptomyces sp. NBC_00162]|uniref:conjugal transfer protein n=1 Tax=Streptomyces sp. NBC_00162 TaxID=2903629 RepID=UPI00214C94F2|nr:conjugal transfer protein [Streptomyces sp. NBC_00162]UUU37539.1 conjugal transfer protein [Streptomyces sp. NBC_00162]